MLVGWNLTLDRSLECAELEERGQRMAPALRADGGRQLVSN